MPLKIGSWKINVNGNPGTLNITGVNPDGTISGAWTFSPDAIQTTTPPYPSRGSGYNYWDGNAWLAAPTIRQDNEALDPDAHPAAQQQIHSPRAHRSSEARSPLPPICPLRDRRSR